MSRNKVLVVDIDPERKPAVVISHGVRTGNEVNPVDSHFDVVSDMATLCEAICTLIHVAENEGIKRSPDSLKDCIEHLEKGFADATYYGALDKQG